MPIVVHASEHNYLVPSTVVANKYIASSTSERVY